MQVFGLKYQENSVEGERIETLLQRLLAEKREKLGIRQKGESNAKCRRVNVEVVAEINRLMPGVTAYAVRDKRFSKLKSGVVGEHVVGIVEDTSRSWFYGFDGTADQVLGVKDPVLGIMKKKGVCTALNFYK